MHTIYISSTFFVHCINYLSYTHDEDHKKSTDKKQRQIKEMNFVNGIEKKSINKKRMIIFLLILTSQKISQR